VLDGAQQGGSSARPGGLASGAQRRPRQPLDDLCERLLLIMRQIHAKFSEVELEAAHDVLAAKNLPK
jgi:hypothetical protein